MSAWTVFKSTSQTKRGDIYVRGIYAAGIRVAYHLGVCVESKIGGDIVDFTAEGCKRRSFKEFAQGKDVYKVDDSSGKILGHNCRDPETVAEMALGYVNTTAKYNLLERNCGTFAFRCKLKCERSMKSASWSIGQFDDIKFV